MTRQNKFEEKQVFLIKSSKYPDGVAAAKYRVGWEAELMCWFNQYKRSNNSPDRLFLNEQGHLYLHYVFNDLKCSHRDFPIREGAIIDLLSGIFYNYGECNIRNLKNIYGADVFIDKC